MKRPTLYHALFTFLAFTATSCDKDDDLEVKEAIATLHWSDYAVDGCGFSIVINEKEYKPDNEQDISITYRKNEPTTVKLRYTLPGKTVSYQCGFGFYEAERIIVLSIKP